MLVAGEKIWREQFPARLNQAVKKPVWITRHGVDVAAVISPGLFEELVSRQEEIEDIAALNEARIKVPRVNDYRIVRSD
jgi:PHD/YefM family antitoxin component YafN of YafNO toxin-antitoxin module